MNSPAADCVNKRDMDQNQDPIKLDLPADFIYIYLVHIGVKSSAGFRCWVEATHGSSACRWKCGGDEESAGSNWSILILHSVYVSPVCRSFDGTLSFVKRRFYWCF